MLSFLGTGFAAPIESAFEKTKVNGLFQFWYMRTDKASPADAFSMKRAELKFSGEVNPEILWSVSIDPAAIKEDSKVTTTMGMVTAVTVGRKSPLQDIILTFKPIQKLSVDVGQYKVPFGMESLDSSAKLDFAERALYNSVLKWGDYRDIGVTFKSNFKAGDVPIVPAVGFYNGEGQNTAELNSTRSMVARVTAKPIDTLHVGLAYYDGKSGVAETNNTRTGAEVRYIKDDVTAYGEYMTGKSGTVNRASYYATLTYKFASVYQAAARYDYLDLNTDTSGDSGTQTSLGINRFIEKHNAKLQLNYVMCGEETTAVDNDIIRFVVQVSF
ncbi:MAG: hypothetical protein A2339_06375 [Elusimicrobia bacterium RIFOXYB12_FULL_50_12]|nr:MAG: hypothetical protein A2339_06375 [Elusimicrobia bacterium RIFOXYB12_FULL_50_12]